MRNLNAIFFVLFCIPGGLWAQKTVPLPHGSTFGKRVDTTQHMPATKIEAFMGNKTRISTMLTGKVLKVEHSKGGWFDLDAGAGKIIKVHFKNYGINIPVNLKGRQIIIEGTAQKQFIADDMQHYAGDTVSGKKQHQVKTNPNKGYLLKLQG
ncbi:uncharacterized protein DUF4920 [Mucilaginibacter gracilis]|uniref:Uncharacterized protein DUF4920 n=1 Tax=Mucilaginibacter gracilis TaxID=423350 RepID=A0A495IY47_9SPHI|nr:DUF4920 domain-containing protein [Mucilaginibacter gracilis]RKR81617.1 uncharacterized protein DUF4920 [Mucilaginibacter gracilis]